MFDDDSTRFVLAFGFLCGLTLGLGVSAAILLYAMVT